MPLGEPKFFKLEAEIEEKKERKSTPENREVIEDIIEHPVGRIYLENYKTFCDYYFGNKLKLKKEELEEKEIKLPSQKEIKERADQAFADDSFNIYEDVLKLKKPKKEEKWDYREDLKEIFIKHFTEGLEEKEIEQLREAKERGKEDFSQALKNIFIERSLPRDGIRVGKFYVTIGGGDKEWCALHIPRFAEDWNEVLQEHAITNKKLAEEYLSRDERFKSVKKLEIISWIYGVGKRAKDFDRLFGWNHYTDEEIKSSYEGRHLDGIYLNEYKGMQFAGIRNSRKLFEDYLIEKKMPKIGGRWITKEEFMEKQKRV